MSTTQDQADQYVVGVDYGTLSGRAVVVRVSDGAELGTAVHEYPHAVVEDRLRAVGAADLVVALYNPASRSRSWQVAAARDALLEVRSGDVPVVVGRDVGRAEESLTVTTLRAGLPSSRAANTVPSRGCGTGPTPIAISSVSHVGVPLTSAR